MAQFGVAPFPVAGGQIALQAVKLPIDARQRLNVEVPARTR